MVNRRWTNVPALALAAFNAASGPGLPAPDHADVRTDLVHLYRHRRFAKILTNLLWGELLPSLIEANKNDPAFDGMLPRLDRGELKRDTNTDWIIDTLSRAIYYRYLISGGRLDDKGLVDWAVDCILSSCRTEPSAK